MVLVTAVKGIVVDLWGFKLYTDDVHLKLQYTVVHLAGYIGGGGARVEEGAGEGGRGG